MSPPDHDGGMNNMTMMPMAMMMQMNFYWGKDAIILFSGWPDGRLGMYILALFLVFFLAAAVEVLLALPVTKPTMSPLARGFAQAAVHTVRMGLAYLVMLSVMSFNGGVFIVAVLGHGVGSFLVKSQVLGTSNGGAGDGNGSTPTKF